MTKFTKLIAAVAMLWLISEQATPLMAYNFQVGQLYYGVTDAAKREVAVVSENSSYPYYNNAPTGTITIPATVTNEGNTYSVTSIGNNAFSACEGLTSINIPSSVTSIGNNAFSACEGLTSINIPSSVTSIGNNAFSACKGLTSINIPSSVTSIGMGAFEGCSGLTSINIPNGVTNIEGYTFLDCKGLTSITFPSSLKYIGVLVLGYCTKLTSVTVGWQTPLPIGSNVFEGVTLNNVKLIVPRGTKAAYRAAEVWKEFNPIIADVKHTITYNQSANGTFKVKSGTQDIASGSTVKDGTILTHRGYPRPTLQTR